MMKGNGGAKTGRLGGFGQRLLTDGIFTESGCLHSQTLTGAEGAAGLSDYRNCV